MKKYLFIITIFFILQIQSYANTPLIEAPALNQALRTESPRIVDLRSYAAYSKEHIPTAVHTDYSKWRTRRDGVSGVLPKKSVVQDLIRALGVEYDTHVVLVSGVDSSDDFGKAARVYWTLKVARITNVSILNGGFNSWKNQGYEISSKPETVQKSSYIIGAYDSTLLATQETVREALDDNSVLIVDARPKSFFDGFVKHGEARVGGTIYNAVNLSQFDLLNEDGTLISKQEAQKLYSDIQHSPPAESIISFCNTGHWAAVNWFVFSEYLGEETKLYDGSMVEWTLSKSNKVINVKSKKELADFKKSQN